MQKLSGRPHLRLAPEPSATAGIPIPANLPEDPGYAYQLGRISVLAEVRDEAVHAVANFERFEAMSFDEIEKLIEVLSYFRDAARPTGRPALQLAGGAS